MIFISFDLSSAAGPTPEVCSIRGALIEPPDNITSLLHFTLLT